MEESGMLDEVSLGFEPSNDGPSKDLMVMRRRYRRDLTPDEAHQLFLEWFEEQFSPWVGSIQRDG